MQRHSEDRKFDKKMCANSKENIQHYKEEATNASEEVERYFPGFIAFIDCIIEQQIPRPVDNNKRKLLCCITKSI